MSNEVLKKFIDNYSIFKHSGKLNLEQLVFSIENFRVISVDIEEVVKVINNKSQGDYGQYNIIDYLNAVYNDHIYDLFLKERKDHKMCYWIINTEFYKIFNLYRILVMKANLLISTGSINEIIVKDFERTVNAHISEAITNIRKSLDFLQKNQYSDELLSCTHPFTKLLKMDEFGKMIFQRIFPNINIKDLEEDDEDDEDDEDEEDDEDDEGDEDDEECDVNDEIDYDVQKKFETALNNLNNLSKQNEESDVNNQIIEPLKNLVREALKKNEEDGGNNKIIEPLKIIVKEALKKAGIDIDLDNNTTFTIEQNLQNQNESQALKSLQLLQTQIGNQMKSQEKNQSKMNNTKKIIQQEKTLANKDIKSTKISKTINASNKKLLLNEKLDNSPNVNNYELSKKDVLSLSAKVVTPEKVVKSLTKKKVLENTTKLKLLDESLLVNKSLEEVKPVLASEPAKEVKAKTSKKKQNVVKQNAQSNEQTQSNIVQQLSPVIIENKAIELVKSTLKNSRKSIKKFN